MRASLDEGEHRDSFDGRRRDNRVWSTPPYGTGSGSHDDAGLYGHLLVADGTAFGTDRRHPVRVGGAVVDVALKNLRRRRIDRVAIGVSPDLRPIDFRVFDGRYARHR